MHDPRVVDELSNRQGGPMTKTEDGNIRIMDV